MSLQYALLTILSRKDSTGYAIYKEFANKISIFWNVRHQQIYRALNRLHELDYLTCKVVRQEGKPDKKVFSITELGKEALFDWYHKPLKEQSVRDELCVKLMSCDIFNSNNMIDIIENKLNEYYEMLSRYTEIEYMDYLSQPEISAKDRMERLILKRKIHTLRANISWAEEVQEELADLSHKNHKPYTMNPIG